MFNKKYLGMRPGDLEDKPYAKYWNPEMAPLTDQSREAIDHGLQSSDLGFPIEEANQLLTPGYLPLEHGYVRLENGQVFIATYTPMPGVTGEMIDWWFGWHYMEDQRYKLWHPRSHVGNGALKMIGDDPQYTDREKYVGNTHYADEIFGDSLQKINISFVDPGMFLDTSQFEKNGILTSPTAIVTLRGLPIHVSTITHLVRKTDEGCEMRVRLWMGPVRLKSRSENNLFNKLMGTRLLTKLIFNEQRAKDGFLSSAMEMDHLVTFLPKLYSDYH